MPVTKKNDPRHKRDKGNAADSLIIGAQFQNYTAASGISEIPSVSTVLSNSRSGTGDTFYKVEVPPPESDDWSCLIFITLTGSILGVVQADWQAFSIDGLFGNTEAQADGTLFSSLCSNVTSLALKSNDKASPLSVSTPKNGSSSVSVKTSGGRIEKSVSYSCVYEAKKSIQIFNVSASGSANTNVRNSNNAIALSTVSISHKAHIIAYHVKDCCQKKIFEWKNGKYIYRSKLDKKFKYSKCPESIKPIELPDGGEKPNDPFKKSCYS